MGSQVHHRADNRQYTVNNYGSDDRSVVPPKASVVVGAIPPRPATWVGRPEQAALEQALAAGGRAVVCAGRRGVGKSVLAGVNARGRVAAGDQLVAWVSGESPNALIEGYGFIGARVGEVDPEGDPDRTARRVLGYLNGLKVRGLLVVDNAEEPSELTPWLPTTGECRVLITSNDHEFEELGQAVMVDLFDRDQSVGFLTGATRVDDPDGADRTAEALGDLPLGLAQASAVIRANHWTFQRYLAELEARPLSPLLPRTAAGYPRGLVDAIGLSLAAAARVDAGVRPVLHVVAMLDPAGVSTGLLAELCSALRLEVEVDQALGVAERLSLSTTTGVAETLIVVMHRLTSRTMNERLADGSLAEALVRCLEGLAAVMAGWQPALVSFGQVAEITQQAGFLLGRLATVPAAEERCAAGVRAAERLDSELRRFGLDGLGISLLGQILEIRTRTLGSDHPDTLSVRNSLATSFWAAGRYPEAIALDEETLKHWEEELGREHPDTLTVRNNLATDYWAVGRYEGEAIALDEETLELREHVLGPEHPETLGSRNNLALDYREVGRHAEAIALDEQTLELREHVLGPEHPDTLTSRSNLAAGYWSVGRYTEAIALDEQTLGLREKVLGPEHPHTLHSRNNLANSYRAVGRHDEAIALDEHSLTLLEKVFGPEHPEPLRSRGNLAAGYQAAGRHDEAITLDGQTLELLKKVLGPEHPATLTGRNNLATDYWAVDRYAEAIAMNEETLRLMEEVLGPDHPNTLTSRNNLAAGYREVGRYAEAIVLDEQTLTLREKVLGPDHPDTLTSRNNLGLDNLAAQARRGGGRSQGWLKRR